MRSVCAKPATARSISNRFSPPAAVRSKRGRNQLRGISVPGIGEVMQGAPSVRGGLPSNNAWAVEGADGLTTGVAGKSASGGAGGPASTPAAVEGLVGPAGPPPDPVAPPVPPPVAPVLEPLAPERAMNPHPVEVIERMAIGNPIPMQESLRAGNRMTDLRTRSANRCGDHGDRRGAVTIWWVAALPNGPIRTAKT